MKRAAIILLSIFFLAALIPVFLVFFTLVYLEDKSSPILKQIRVGKNQVPFTCYKIRTMKADTGDVASHHASQAQITKIGAVLRKTGLDELPQIYNVLIGTMSFVGPRPNLPSQEELIAARDKRKVYDVLPGITGLAQIQGVDMSNPAKLAKIDGEYVRIKSILLDCRIVWATIRGKGSGDAVKR
ncbi:MAG: sugar transferase [Pseudomonadota bacterium]